MRPSFELTSSVRRVPGLVLLVAAFAACGGDKSGGTGSAGNQGGSSGAEDGGEAGDTGSGRGGSASGAGGPAGASGGGGASGKGSAGGDAGDGAGEGGGAGAPEPARFSISVVPESFSLSRGASAWLTVHVERESGFTDPVSVTFENLPEGLAAATLTLPASVDSGILPLATSEALAVGRVLGLQATGSSGSERARTPVEVTMAAAEPSSQEKIRAALEATSLDYETSLLYRAYALFRDARLPSAFAGSGSQEEDDGLFGELREHLAELSQQGQENLRPFTLRPADPESAFYGAATAYARVDGSPELASPPDSAPANCDQSGGWMSRRSASEPVRVWARCRGVPAVDAESTRLVEKTLALLHKIYAPMTTLMATPIADQEGGDSAIDFYVVDPDVVVRREEDSFVPGGLGTTFIAGPTVGNGSSAFVLFPRWLFYTSRFHATVIHEFFHVLQKAYNYDYSNKEIAHWFPEASAVWASAHFDRTLAPWEDGRAAYVDAHYRFTQRFQRNTFALNASLPRYLPYAAYIWSFFAEQETQSPLFMKQIWEGLANVGTYEQADDAIDAVFSFRDHFKDFALRNLNSAFMPGDPLPRNRRYVALDSVFPDGPMPDVLEGMLTTDQEYRQGLDLPNLSTRYIRLVADPTASKVELELDGLQPQGSRVVQALVYTRDGWVDRPLDFTSEQRVVFCFNEGPTTATRRGSFNTLLLVISNTALRADERLSGDLVVHPKSAPCGPGWSGTITMSYRRTVSNGVVTSSTSTPVAFEYDDTAPQVPYTTTYRLKSGSYSYEWLGDFTGRNPTCRTREHAVGTMVPSSPGSSAPNSSYATLQIFSFFEPATYSGSGFTLGQGTITSDCNDNNIETTDDWMPAISWWATDYDEQVSDDGRTLEGNYTLPDIGDGAYVYQWHLTRVDD